MTTQHDLFEDLLDRGSIQDPLAPATPPLEQATLQQVCSPSTRHRKAVDIMRNARIIMGRY